MFTYAPILPRFDGTVLHCNLPGETSATVTVYDDTGTALITAATATRIGTTDGFYYDVGAASPAGLGGTANDPITQSQVTWFVHWIGGTSAEEWGRIVLAPIQMEDTFLDARYPLQRVYYDNAGGASGAVLGVNGTVSNPVDNTTDLGTLLTARSAVDVHFSAGYEIGATSTGFWANKRLHADQRGYGFAPASGNYLDCGTSGFRSNRVGCDGWNGGGIDGNVYMTDVAVESGIYRTLTGSATETSHTDCSISGTIDWVSRSGQSHAARIQNCIFSGTVTLDFSSAGATTSLVCVFSSGNVTISGLTNAGQSVTISHLGGTITLDASCTAGTINLDGIGTLVDNSAGATVNGGLLAGVTLDSILTDTAAMQPTVATNLDAAITSRAAAGDAMDLVANAVDAAAIATGAITNASFAAGAIDAAAIATDAIGANELAATAVTEIQTGLATSAEISALTDIDAQGVRDAMKLAPSAGAAAAGSVDTHLDDILADTANMEPTIISNLDTTVSSRAAPGDEMDLVTDAVDANSVATTGANEIRDAILSDSTAFAGANIDAAISGRAATGDAMTLTAAAVDAIWDEDVVAAHTTGDTAGERLATAASGGAGLTQQQVRDALKLAPTAGAAAAGSVDEHLDDILADTAAIQPTVATNLDAAVSSRAATGDAMALTTGAVDAIWDEDVVAAHTTGDTAGERLATAANGGGGLTQQQVRDAMKLAPTAGAAAAGSVDEHLDDVLADTAAMQPTIATNLDAASSTLATSAEIASLNDLAIADVQTALTNQGYTAARAPNLDNADAAVSTRAAPGDAMDLAADAVDAAAVAASAVTEIQNGLATSAEVGALNDIDQAGVQAALTAQGFTAARAPNLDNLDAASSTLATAANATANQSAILLRFTAVEGATFDTSTDSLEAIRDRGDAAWSGGGGGGLTQQEVRDAMKLAPSAGAAATGSVDEHLDDILADTAVIQPLVSSFLDAAVSSRSATGDAMTLTAGERTSIATAVRDISLTGATVGTLGGAALVSQNSRMAYRLDGGAGVPAVQRDANGFITSARLRIFASLADATASTAGAAGTESALITSTISGTPDGTFPTVPQTMIVGT